MKHKFILIFLILFILNFISVLCTKINGSESNVQNETALSEENASGLAIAKQNLSTFLQLMIDRNVIKAVDLIDPSYFQSLVDEMKSAAKDLDPKRDNYSFITIANLKEKFIKKVKSSPIKLKSFQIMDSKLEKDGKQAVFIVKQFLEDLMGKSVSTETFYLSKSGQEWFLSGKNLLP